MSVGIRPADVRTVAGRGERQCAALVVVGREGANDPVGEASRCVVGRDLLAKPHADRDPFPQCADAGMIRRALGPARPENQGSSGQVGRVDQPVEDALRELPAAAENVRDRAEFIVNAAWEAFSSPTSMAALEILIATRAMRDTGASEHLAALGTTFAKLGRHIGEGLEARHAAAIGSLIWATLRGLVVAAMVVPEPPDTRPERRALVDM